MKVETVEQEEDNARLLFQKCSILKNLNIPENKFCDFTCQKKGGCFSKRKFKFEIFYKYNRNIYISCYKFILNKFINFKIHKSSNVSTFLINVYCLSYP